MPSLISAGVSVTITDESFFIPSAAPTVPLIFIATAAEKTRPDGITIAEGTAEYGVVRSVTSLKQSTDLYGIPRFLRDTAGASLHGDARNEYGLAALNTFLQVGNLAYVLRANVNLDDNITSLRSLWTRKTDGAASVLSNSVVQLINQFNATNGYLPSNPLYKVTVTPSEFLSLATSALTPVFDLYSFKHIQRTPTINDFTSNFTTTPQNVYANGYDQPATNIFIGLAGLAAEWAATAVAGIHFGAPVRAATTPATGNITLAGLQTIDGVALAAGDRVLVKDQTLATANGVYIVAAGAWTRATDADTTAELDGFAVLIQNGTVNANDVWEQATNMPIVGTDPLVWSLYTGDLTTSGSLVPGEFTATEATNLFLSAAAEFQFTQEFLLDTGLGANDQNRRVAITTALSELILTNTEIRSEAIEYNLILTPGYSELVDEMLSLNLAIDEEAFIIADTPMNLDPQDTFGPAGWSASVDRRNSNNVAYYYPHVLMSNLDGHEILASASAIALRTFAYSDNIAYLWFAPAGIRRGSIVGISNLGYASGTLGQPTDFVEVHVNKGQRDEMYGYTAQGGLNPLVFFPGRGFLIWGQKTSTQITASAMDRVNVSRLMKYIKRQLRKGALPFVFEPNDQITRNSLKSVVDGLLGDIMVKRGLYDFASICDSSNNTPDRIDRNELWLDVLVKPVKAAEFLYIPIRVVATGAEI